MWSHYHSAIRPTPNGVHIVSHFLGPPITSFFGEGVGPIHLSEVHCNGSEQKLTDCTTGNGVISLNGCDHGNDVGVICQGEYSYIIIQWL